MPMSNSEAVEITRRAPALAPFDWTEAGHAVVKAGEAVDWDFSDPASFIKRVQSIEYGLSAETEFAAILSWLGRCTLVHRLDQDWYSAQSDSAWCIPDLLAVFEHEGVRLPVLIEVKTRKRERLSLQTAELVSMRRYAEVLSLPLLFAWKPRRLGFWLLVDPAHFVEQGGKSILTLEPAMKNNLLSAVAGDFIVVPKAGAGLFFEAKVIKQTHSTKSGWKGIAQIAKAEFRDATGAPAKNIPVAILALMFSRMELVDEVIRDQLRKSFVTQEQSVHAQEILRTCVAFRAKAAKPIKWRHVAKDLHAYLSRESLHDEVQKHVGTFVQYQFFQHPQVWPPFLPSAWNAIS